MDKRYQVFVSSTYKDLQDERKEVMQALLELDCIPAGMELFPASNDDQWTLIKKVIDDCDYYILILAGRYGSVNEDGMGYTEMEYRYALAANKPIIAFLHKNPGDISSAKTEDTQEGKERLNLFRDLAQKKMTKYWTNPYDLGSVVSRSMITLIKTFPATGWVKADNITDENTMKELLRLQKENKELKEQLELSNIQAPDGAENFSQGEDTIVLNFVYRYFDKQNNRYSSSMDFVFTWNELFKVVAPYLVNECDEVDMTEVITTYMKEKCHDEIIILKSEMKIRSFDKIQLKVGHFQIIKVQFQALGLIQKSIKNRSVKDNLTYWKLTPYGERTMTQLVAIKKEK